MADLSAFPITRRWPAAHPDRLQLYSLPTPNGVKVSIMLEEIGLPYEAHLVDFGKDDQKTAGIPVAQSERQDPGDSRSRRPRRQTARPVRIRRDPAIPRREDRTSCCRRTRRSAGRPSSGCISRWARRADVRAGRLLPQVRRQGFRGQAPARSLRGRIEAAARRHGRASGDAPVVRRRRLHHRRYLDARLGAQSDRVLRGAGTRRVRQFRNVAAWLERGLARPAVQRGLEIPKRK